MKHIVIALILLFGTMTLSAKNLIFAACAKTQQRVMLPVILNDQMLTTAPEIEEHIGQAFIATARDFSPAELISPVGFAKFLSYLTDEDRAAIDGLALPVVMPESCQVATTL